jgi:IMP and pyridine-specific 5'-nucleotidase
MAAYSSHLLAQLSNGLFCFHFHGLILSSIQGLLAVPFVLNSQPTTAYEEYDEVNSLEVMVQNVRRRYAEIMRDVEGLVNDHSRYPALL